MMERAKPVAFPGTDPGFRADAKSDPWIGRAIQARYQVSRRLAAGLSGNLYIAHDGETGVEVTIKLLPAGSELDDDLVRRLRDELSVTRAIARIRPNVAGVHDCDRAADGRAFMVLEPLDGRSLADWIGQEGALPVERALRLAFEIADGLQAAHDLVLVHGALDAEHVLVGAEDTVKLTGFEVARLGGAGLNAGGLTERADIQALGMLLMQMLTGAVRPRSEGYGAHPERKLGPEVPAAVRELVMQALGRSPEPRAHDMGAVANTLWVDLNRVTERPISAVRGPARAGRPWAKWRTVGIGALVVVGLALGAWVTRDHLMAPPLLPPVIQAVPAAQTPPAPAAGVPEAAPVERSAEVVVMPAPPVPRTPPPVTPVGAALVTPRATPPGPVPSATRSPLPATPERARGTPGARVMPRPASARVTVPPSATAERTAESAEATPRAPVSPAPESGSSPDPSAIIDWLLTEYPRRQR